MPWSWKPQWRSVALNDIALLALASRPRRLARLVVFAGHSLPVVAIAGACGVWLFYVQHNFEGGYWVRGADWNAATGSRRRQLVLRPSGGAALVHRQHRLPPHPSPRAANSQLPPARRTRGDARHGGVAPPHSARKFRVLTDEAVGRSPRAAWSVIPSGFPAASLRASASRTRWHEPAQDRRFDFLVDARGKVGEAIHADGTRARAGHAVCDQEGVIVARVAGGETERQIDLAGPQGFLVVDPRVADHEVAVVTAAGAKCPLRVQRFEEGLDLAARQQPGGLGISLETHPARAALDAGHDEQREAPLRQVTPVADRG